MTDKEFRASPEHRPALLAALSTESVQLALGIVKSKNELVSLPLGCTGIDAGRAHEERVTRALVVAELFALCQPLPEPAPDRQPEDLGTKFTVDQFDQPEPTTV